MKRVMNSVSELHFFSMLHSDLLKNACLMDFCINKSFSSPMFVSDALSPNLAFTLQQSSLFRTSSFMVRCLYHASNAKQQKNFIHIHKFHLTFMCFGNVYPLLRQDRLYWFWNCTATQKNHTHHSWTKFLRHKD